MKEVHQILGNVVASEVRRFLKKLEFDEDRKVWLSGEVLNFCCYRCGKIIENSVKCSCYGDN